MIPAAGPGGAGPGGRTERRFQEMIHALSSSTRDSASPAVTEWSQAARPGTQVTPAVTVFKSSARAAPGRGRPAGPGPVAPGCHWEPAQRLRYRRSGPGGRTRRPLSNSELNSEL